MAIQFPASAAPPLAADDASTLNAGECQFEIEHRRYGDRAEQDIGPACNFFLDIELGVSHQRIAPDSAARANSIIYQGKRVLFTSTDLDWAFALAAATVQARAHESGTRKNFFNAIITRKLAATALHLNAGMVADREALPGTRKNKFSWALAAEHDATERVTLVGELFGERGMPATSQIGVRWWLMPKQAQLTTSIGTQRGGGRDARWASIGIRFETAKPIF
jgi:hypothetical protein